MDSRCFHSVNCIYIGSGFSNISIMFSILMTPPLPPGIILLKLPVLLVAWQPSFYGETREASLEAGGSPKTRMRGPSSRGINFVVYTTQFHSFREEDSFFFPLMGVEAWLGPFLCLNWAERLLSHAAFLVKTPVFSPTSPCHPALSLVWVSRTCPWSPGKTASSEPALMVWFLDQHP